VEPDWLETMAGSLPLVQLGRHDASENYDTIVSDDVLGTRQGMAHLLERGHRRIAHVTHLDPRIGESTTTPHAVRRAGYEQAMPGGPHRATPGRAHRAAPG
jgi:LacI family transcriptional regulator